MTGGVFISYRREDSGGIRGANLRSPCESPRTGERFLRRRYDPAWPRFRGSPFRARWQVRRSSGGDREALGFKRRLGEPPPPRRSPRLCPHRNRGRPQSQRAGDSRARRRRGDASSRGSAGQPDEADPSAGRRGFARPLRLRCGAADPGAGATRRGDAPAGSQPAASAGGWIRGGAHEPSRCDRARSQPCSRAVGTRSPTRFGGRRSLVYVAVLGLIGAGAAGLLFAPPGLRKSENVVDTRPTGSLMTPAVSAPEDASARTSLSAPLRAIDWIRARSG